MSDSEVYQDDHVPKGSEAEPLAELAYGLQVPCSAALRKERYHHKPVYSLQRHQRRVAFGSIGKKCASL